MRGQRRYIPVARPSSVFVLSVLCCLVWSRGSAAQSWTSTDVGAVGLQGSASVDSSGNWTVQGSGADIWGTSDAFQFVHQTVASSGSLLARVDAMENASGTINPFAKAGVMIRASLDPSAAMAILDLKPDGSIEFMTRGSNGASVIFIATASVSFPQWLRLEWSGGTVTASISSDATSWRSLGASSVALPSAPEGGLAVTSHDNSQLTTGHFDSLSSTGVVQIHEWTPVVIGSTGLAGQAAETNGVWTVNSGRTDIWGTSDSFEFVYRTTTAIPAYVEVRVVDLQNTNPFAKAGVMLRSSLDADAPAVILDVRPDGALEFMARRSVGGEMMFLGGGTVVPFPVWLKLVWTDNNNQTLSVAPMFSSDGINWTDVAPAATVDDPNYAIDYAVGVAGTSHDEALLATAHVDHLSLLGPGTDSTDIGAVGFPGNAAADGDAFIIQGAGSDIWGSSDSFQFVHGAREAVGVTPVFAERVVQIDNTSPFAKAGLMFRDTLDADSAFVILDARPDGAIEFMARLCAGCEVTFIATANITFPSYLELTQNGSTYSASVFQSNPGAATSLGSVTVPMSQPYAGYAVTSHNPGAITTAVFDNPPR